MEEKDQMEENVAKDAAVRSCMQWSGVYLFPAGRHWAPLISHIVLP